MKQDRLIIGDFINLSLIIIMCVFLGNYQQLIIGLFLFLSLFYFINNDQNRLFILFIILFLSNGIISREYYWGGFIGVQQIVAIVAVLAILKSKKNINYSNPVSKTAKILLLFVFFYIVYTSIKNAYFGLFDTTWLSAIVKTINFFIFIELILYIYKKTVSKELFFYRVIINVIFFFCITCLISPLLGKLGYYTSVGEEGSLQRFNGFIGNGDANTLALILVLSVGYILNKAIIYRLDTIKISMMLLSIITIGLTGSRSGLILLGFVFLFTPFFFKKIKIFSKYTIVILLMIFFSAIFLSTNIERLNTAQEEQMTTALGTGNRVGKWLFYINYFKQSPYSLFRGASDALEVGFDHSFIVAHNIYLQIIYNSGLLFLFALIYIIYKSLKINIYIHENILILIIPLVLGLFFISDYGAILFFVICLFGMTLKQKDTIHIK